MIVTDEICSCSPLAGFYYLALYLVHTFSDFSSILFLFQIYFSNSLHILLKFSQTNKSHFIHSLILMARVGSTFQPLPIACYDIYENRIPFTSNPEVMFKIQTSEVVVFPVKKLKTSLSASKMNLEVEVWLVI